MTKQARRNFLYLLIALFLVLGGGAVFYAQGWRVAFGSQKGLVSVDKIGGIYIRSYPSDAEVKLNGKSVPRGAHIFERGTLVNNLFPGSYSVSVAKDGYATWQANLPVSPALVTSKPHVVLIPIASELATTTSISDFEAFGEEIYLENSRGKISEENVSIPGDQILAGSSDGQMILSTDEISYFYFDRGNATSTNLNRTSPRLVPILKDSNKFIFLPGSENLLVAESSSSLRLIDLSTARINTLADASATISSAAFSSTRLAWTTYDPQSKHSALSIYDNLADNFNRGADLILGQVTQLEFIDRGTLIALTKEGNLYRLEPEAGLSQKLAEGVINFKLSPDLNALAVNETQGLEIIYLRDSNRSIFLGWPNLKTATDFIWHKDLSHLFVIYPNQINFLDLDDTSLQNNLTIASGTQFTYLPGANALYALNSTTLRKFQLP